MRHGTHLPHDSLRKNFTAFKAMSSMQRPSAHTTIAPDPSIDPMAASDLKSSRTSTFEAGRYPDEGPDGANAFSFFPSTIPPARLKITSDIGRPIGISNTPGVPDVAADADKLQSGRAAYALRLVPLDASHQNLRHVGERLHVVQRRRLVEHALRHRKRRFVARFGAFALDGFDQRALFAANVSAGADEQFQVEAQAGAEHARAQQAFFVAALDLFVQNSFLRSDTRAGYTRMPFCAPVTRPAMIMPSITRFGRLRMMKRSLMVPGSLSSALHTTYFSEPRSLRTASHLMPVGNPAPPNPAQPAGLQLRDHPVPIARGNQSPQRAILFAASVGIGTQTQSLFSAGISGSSLPPSAVSTNASACAVVTLR